MTYWIERRDAGWPRYRVMRRMKTLGALLTGGDQKVTRSEGDFWTYRGARRYIARVTWTKIEEFNA